MKIYKLISYFFCFLSTTYAGNTGAGSAPVSPTQSNYNSQWTSYRQSPPMLQESRRAHPGAMPTSGVYIDQNGERWEVFQDADGSYWGMNSQEEFKRLNQPLMEN